MFSSVCHSTRQQNGVLRKWENIEIEQLLIRNRKRPNYIYSSESTDGKLVFNLAKSFEYFSRHERREIEIVYNFK